MIPRRPREILFLVLAVSFIGLARGDESVRRAATVDDLLKFKSLSAASISPDGGYVAFGVTEADVKQDAFVTQLWVAETASGKTWQLTRGEKSAEKPTWSPDGRWLAFTSDRAGGKSQIFAISPQGGEAVQLTRSESGVRDFAWSPDGKAIAFIATPSDTRATNERKEYLGDYSVVRKEYKHAHLWTIDVAEALQAPAAGVARTQGKDFTVGSFSWAPDGARIAFSATLNPDLIQRVTADICVLSLADDSVKKIVSQPGPDTNPRWSPDGNEIVFQSAMGALNFYHSNSRLAVVFAEGGTPRSLTDAFDEHPLLVDWKPDGVYFVGFQKTASHLLHVHPATAQLARISNPADAMVDGVSLTDDGQMLAFLAGSPTSLAELFVSRTHDFEPQKLTDMSGQLEPFLLGTPEVISWKSQDGALIEGVLTKPPDFDPLQKRPLLCILHGGPVGIDRPRLLTGARYYPLDVWAARGALILRVNYRGSLGYGEKFRQLNVRNLGVGDAWDVHSGIDELIAKGWVDSARIGCMGWSQGGYISAFLAASSNRFAAISVGAGISNWATYYYNTDSTPFTIQYLGKKPAEDPEIYRTTSPISYLQQACTPTLIQHGDNDRRVPIANAHELRQGLDDRGVKVEMIVYKGSGHDLTRPKTVRAAMLHNLGWFNHYLWGDSPPNFTEMPRP